MINNGILLNDYAYNDYGGRMFHEPIFNIIDSDTSKNKNGKLDIKCLNQYPLFLLQKENRLCLCFILFNNNKETFPKNTGYNKNNFQEKIYYFDVNTYGIRAFFNFLLINRNKYVEDFVLLSFDINLNHTELFQI